MWFGSMNARHEYSKGDAIYNKIKRYQCEHSMRVSDTGKEFEFLGKKSVDSEWIWSLKYDMLRSILHFHPYYENVILQIVFNLFLQVA